jgi:type VII secretion-associated serine protease mycosin
VSGLAVAALVAAGAAAVASPTAAALPAPGVPASVRSGAATAVAAPAIQTPAAAAAATPPPDYARDRVLLRFAPGASAADRARALLDAGLSATTAVDGTPYVDATVHGTVSQAVRTLLGDPAVAAAQPVYRRHATSLVDAPVPPAASAASAARGAIRPTDPRYAGAEARAADLMRLPQAWAVRRDSSVVVAVIDTGVDLGHPDLAGRLVPGHDFVGNDSVPQDENGHGTQVAGVIGAVPDNGRGIAGVVWDARIMPVRVLDADGYGFDDTIAKGIAWAADHGAKVINLSLGGPQADPVLQSAVHYATRKGALVVVAAGNDGNDAVQYPAAYPEALAVAATDATGTLTQFSSYGDWVDVAAPGWEVLSTALRVPGSSAYVAESGTSFSAPYVAGVAALVRAQHPSWTVAHVRRQITTTARDAGAPGFDEFYGFGVVDAYAALGGPPGPRVGPAFVPDAFDSPAHAVSTLPATQTIGTEGDVDWFRYHASGPMWARVQVSGGSTYRDNGPQALNPLVSVYDGRLDALRGAASDGGGQPVSIDVWFAAAGDYYVKVRNAYPCRSPLPYSVRVAPTDAPATGLQQHETAVDLGAQSGGVAIGDVTGDGRPDLVLSSAASFEGPSFLTVVPGEDGHISDRRVFYDAKFFWPAQGTVAIGDVNGDGRGDVVLGTDSGAQLFLQTSRGTLTDKGIIPGTTGGTVAVVPHAGGGRVVAQTRDNDGDPRALGVFTLRGGKWDRQIVGTLAATQIEVGDLNGDGVPDIAATDGSPVVTMFIDSGSSYTTRTITPQSGHGVGALEVADVTGDGRADVITTSERYAPRGSVTVLPQVNGGLSYGGTASYAGSNGPVEAGDVDGDGRAELVITSARSLVILRVNADGMPGDATSVRLSPTDVQTPPNGLAVGDLDGDGVAEVVTRTSSFTYLFGHPLPDWALVQATSPRDGARGVPRTVAPAVTFARDVVAATVSAATVRLVDDRTHTAVAVRVTYDAATRTATARPLRPLAGGTAYTVIVAGVSDGGRRHYRDRFTFVVTAA